MKLFLLAAALILSTSVYAQDASKFPTGGGKSAARLKPKAVGCTLVELSGVLGFGPVTVRRQTSLEAAFRQPKAASHLCRIKPLERSHPARNDSRHYCARPICNGYWPARPVGIFIDPIERGEIGPDLFRNACNMG